MMRIQILVHVAQVHCTFVWKSGLTAPERRGLPHDIIPHRVSTFLKKSWMSSPCSRPVSQSLKMQCFMPRSNKVPDLHLVADKRHSKKGNKDIEALQGTEYHLSR